MSAYPGEQELWDVQVEAGAHSWYDVYYACYPDATWNVPRAFVVGDDFFINAGADLLIETDVVVQANWIFELNVGGTFELTMGFDLDYEYDVDLITWEATQTLTLEAGRHYFPLPANQRTFPELSGDTGAPTLRIKVTGGAPVIAGAYIQVEGEIGLQESTGWVWGDWITPPLTATRGPGYRFQSVQWARDVTSGPHGTEADITDAVNAALDVTVGSAPVSFTDIEGGYGSYSVQASNSAEMDTSRTGNNVTVTWRIWQQSITLRWMTNDTTFRPHAVAMFQPTLKFDRDQVGYEYDPTGFANAVSWKPGWTFPRVNHLLVGPDSYGNSYQNDSYPFYGTGVSTLSGSMAQLNVYPSELPPLPEGDASFPWTPPPGEVVMGAGPSTWSTGAHTVPPPAGWCALYFGSYGATRAYGFDTHTSWYISSDRNLRFGGPPLQMVQLPDYRLKIPTFIPSGDAIVVAEPELEPTFPPAGYLMNPDPNLLGLNDRVDVNFG